MERRIGSVLIYVGNREAAPQVNAVLSRHAGIGSLTGQLGRIEGIEVKSALLKGRET